MNHFSDLKLTLDIQANKTVDSYIPRVLTSRLFWQASKEDIRPHSAQRDGTRMRTL